MGEEGQPAVVVDNGSAIIKAGFSGQDSPQAVFPSVVGRPKANAAIIGADDLDVYVGYKAVAKRGVLDLACPIEHGIVTSWDAMERIWHHIFYNELRVAPDEHPVLLTEPPLNPKANREKMTKIMFETFSVPSMYATMPAVLSMYASGSITGVALDLGHGVSHAVPIYEGYALPHAIIRSDVAGCDHTDYMIKLMQESGYSFVTTAEREVVRHIKETLTYVALDFDAEMAKHEESSEGKKVYQLPDGRTIKVTSQRFRCPELLFKPTLIWPKAYGVHEILYSAINRVKAKEEQKAFYGNIVLSGGASMYRGLQARLTKEMVALAPATMEVKVVAPPERKCSAWMGGAIFAAMSSCRAMWVTKEQFDDTGPSIVHRMCLEGDIVHKCFDL